MFYKVGNGEKAKFLKFAEYTPVEYTKLYDIMKEKASQEFFIHENDLARYYQECILKNLKVDIDKGDLTTRELFQKVYTIASRIIGDYLEIRASERILRSLDDLPKYLVDAMGEKAATFPEIFVMVHRDGSIHTHCVNVGFYCLFLGHHLKLSANELLEVCRGGMLADIGKKFIPEEVMGKQGELTPDDFQYIRKHPSYGRKVLNDLKCYSDIVLCMVGEHHENFDGTGYPFGYAGDKISYHGRICKVMDVFNALTSKRSYSERLNPLQALSIMKNDMPGQFDMDILVILFRALGPR